MTLKDFFIKYPKIAIAFSGGTDSAYLCYMAKKYAKEMTAIYVSTAFQPTFEKEDAIRFCKEYAIPLTILERDVLSQEAVVQNPANRCYYCKKVIFSEIQKKALELGFTKEDAYNRFGFLLDAFKFGVPPHAGLAYGLDRLVMWLTGEDSIRDVIAFPKVKDASCLMTQAPGPVDTLQLEELGIELSTPEEE